MDDATSTASAEVVAVPPGGCGIPRREHSSFHRSRSSARSIEAGEVPSTSSSGMIGGQLERGLAAQRDDDADQPASVHRCRPLGVEHVGHVLGRQRLEVEAVGGVVVGRDGLGVAVDHHRLVAGGPQGHRGVDAAVVELDALADPVGPRAQDHHPGAVRWPHLVLVLGGRVVVRRVGLELGAAGVHRLVGHAHPQRRAGAPGCRRPSPGPRTGRPAAGRRSPAGGADATPAGPGPRP